MSHSEKCTVVDSIEAVESGGAGVLYRNAHDCIILNCPGCGRRSAMTVYNEGEPKPPKSDGPSWKITGPPETPTLDPSLNHRVEVGGCGWHGYLRGGKFSLA